MNILLMDGTLLHLRSYGIFPHNSRACLVARSSNRELRTRVPFLFSVVYCSRRNPPNQKVKRGLEGHQLLGDLGGAKWNSPLSDSAWRIFAGRHCRAQRLKGAADRMIEGPAVLFLGGRHRERKKRAMRHSALVAELSHWFKATPVGKTTLALPPFSHGIVQPDVSGVLEDHVPRLKGLGPR